MEPPVAECAALPDAAAAAWTAFRDAELAEARRRARVALDARGCQATVVPRDTLLELYRLDALLARSTGDADGLVAATIRAVVAGPDAPPPERYGQDLAAAFATWAGRLRGAQATVTVDGGGTAWIDGVPVTAGSPATLVQGEHLIQVAGPDGALLAVRLVDLTADVRIPTPGVGSAPATIPAPPPAPQQDEAPRRRHPAWAFVLAGAGAGLAGGGGAYAAWLDDGCAAGTADPVGCAAVRPYVNLWLGAAVGGGALALAGTVLGVAGLPAKD